MQVSRRVQMHVTADGQRTYTVMKTVVAPRENQSTSPTQQGGYSFIHAIGNQRHGTYMYLRKTRHDKIETF